MMLSKSGRCTRNGQIEALSHPCDSLGSHSLQIFWQSPGAQIAENFIIRFRSDEELRGWTERVSAQVAAHQGSRPPSSRDRSQSINPHASQQSWTSSQTLTNPYQEYDSNDSNSTIQPSMLPTMTPFPVHIPGPYAIPRNVSSNSLRSRSGTAESNHGRGNYPRFGVGQFPAGAGPLSIHTSTLSGTPSNEADRSYFSPIAETPTSSRTSASSNQITDRTGVHRGIMHAHVLSDDKGRPIHSEIEPFGTRDEFAALRANRGPSLPANASAQMLAAQSRNRSASSPDAHGIILRRNPASMNQPPVPAVPAHLQTNGINRSQNSSPSLAGTMTLPTRAATQSPGMHNQRVHHNKSPSYFNQNIDPYDAYGSSLYERSESSLGAAVLSPGVSVTSSRTVTPGAMQGLMGSSNQEDSRDDLPHQVKIKINYKDFSVSLIASRAISYASLVGRIDAKLAKSLGPAHNNSVAQGHSKLTYLDEDGDRIAITGDEDIKEAISEWAQEHRARLERDQLNGDRAGATGYQQTANSIGLQLFCEEIGKSRG